MVARSNPPLGHGRLTRPRTFYVQGQEILRTTNPQIVVSALSFQDYRPGRREDDEFWVAYDPTFEFADVSEQIWFVHPWDEEEFFPDVDDDFFYRLDDQVYDTDQVIVIEVHDDAYPHDEDDWIYRLEDQPAAVSDNEQIVIVFLDDDAKEEFEDEWSDAYAQVEATDVSEQIWVVVDHEERIDEDDDFIYRLDDQVYDLDHITVIVDHEEEIHVDDDYIYRLDDLVFDVDHIVGYITEYDEYYTVDPEDDLYDAYGNFDTPTVVVTTDIHFKPFLSTMGRMGALGGLS